MRRVGAAAFGCLAEVQASKVLMVEVQVLDQKNMIDTEEAVLVQQKQSVARQPEKLLGVEGPVVGEALWVPSVYLLM